MNTSKKQNCLMQPYSSLENLTNDALRRHFKISLRHHCPLLTLFLQLIQQKGWQPQLHWEVRWVLTYFWSVFPINMHDFILLCLSLDCHAYCFLISTVFISLSFENLIDVEFFIYATCLLCLIVYETKCHNRLNKSFTGS